LVHHAERHSFPTRRSSDLIARFTDEPYSLGDLRTLHRVAATLATSCRRLAAQPWITPAAHAENRAAVISGVTEAMLEAMDRARRSEEHTSELQSRENLVCR